MNQLFSGPHTPPFNGPFSGTTRVSRYQKGETNLDFTEARDSEWQWHQQGHMQVCISLQTDNHASTPPLKFFTDWMPFLPPNQQRQSTFLSYSANKQKNGSEHNPCQPVAGVTTKTKLSLRKGIMPHEYICLVSEMGMTQTSRNCAHQHSYQLVVHTELMATILSSLWVPSMLVCAVKPINSSTGKIQKNN